METSLQECEKQALQLPVRDRAALAEHLIASLDDSDERNTEALWLEEAERRYQGYKAGRVPSRPAAEVLRDARKAVQ